MGQLIFMFIQQEWVNSRRVSLALATVHGSVKTYVGFRDDNFPVILSDTYLTITRMISFRERRTDKKT